jgi:uncharacterized protein (UPF0276 family)
VESAPAGGDNAIHPLSDVQPSGAPGSALAAGASVKGGQACLPPGAAVQPIWLRNLPIPWTATTAVPAETPLPPEIDMQDARHVSLPARAGVGLKPEHVAEILGTVPAMGFFEVHAENYMGAGGPPHAQLRAIRDRYALSLHGVGLSIGADRALDRDHLARLRDLDRRYAPASFSEHLAWSTHDDVFFNDLLPVPYTQETLARVIEHIDETQSFLGRRMLLENPSTYLLFRESTIAETDFLDEVARRTGCGLLLDINNVFVSATNHATSPEDYLAAFPLHRVGEIHLAGHAPTEDETGAPLLIDSHDRPVSDPVWLLYESVIARTGPIPTLIEWDNDVPPFAELQAEARRADAVMARHADRRAA